MSRTRRRIMLILLILILIVASVLSSLLTHWVGAGDLPASTPTDGKVGWLLQTGGRVWLGLQHARCAPQQPLRRTSITC